jgi:hypothetical protein
MLQRCRMLILKLLPVPSVFGRPVVLGERRFGLANQGPGNSKPEPSVQSLSRPE